MTGDSCVIGDGIWKESSSDATELIMTSPDSKKHWKKTNSLKHSEKNTGTINLITHSKKQTASS